MENIFEIFWKEIKIGNVLKRDKEYVFKYDQDGIKQANQQGFEYIIGFKDITQEYTSEKLFPIFTSRIPPKNRHNIEEIMQKLDIAEYDEIEILKKTNGKCYTDEIEMR